MALSDTAEYWQDVRAHFRWRATTRRGPICKTCKEFEVFKWKPGDYTEEERNRRCKSCKAQKLDRRAPSAPVPVWAGA